jgi:hypothetical protein
MKYVETKIERKKIYSTYYFLSEENLLVFYENQGGLTWQKWKFEMAFIRK